MTLSKCARKPQIGEVISVIPNHCRVVTNMMDEVYAARGGKVEAVYPVAARGQVRSTLRRDPDLGPDHKAHRRGSQGRLRPPSPWIDADPAMPIRCFR